MKQPKRRFLHHFYSRLMLVNTAIVCTATLVYGLVATRTAFTYERINGLKPYEFVLNQLHIHFLNKQEAFTRLMLTLFEDADRFRALGILLEGPGSDLASLSAFERKDITDLLMAMCNKDEDIHSVYITKASTRSVYGYSPVSNVLKPVTGQLPLFEDLAAKSYARTVYGAQLIPVLAGPGRESIVYGIGGNLSTLATSVLQKPGTILVAYDTSRLSQYLQNAELPFGGRFLILTESGLTVFDSDRDTVRRTEPTVYPHAAALLSGAETLSLDGTDYYVSVLRDRKRGFLTAALVPKANADHGSRRLVVVIAIGSLLFMSLSLFVAFLSSRFSTRRFALLETAMSQIGSNNLAYRMPVAQRRDEFSAIARRFNEMCDELESNIRLAYGYRLRQQQAQLHALQASINPHFLYNTLEAIRGRLAKDGNDEAAEMIVLLSRLYRSQIKGRTFVTLREETNLCGMYLELFSLRHDNAITAHIAIPNDLMRCAIPKNTLQPVLENYLVHGLREDGNEVSIAAERDGDFLRITVTDNGHGIPARRLRGLQERRAAPSGPSEDREAGLGLSSVNDRLRLVFGEDCGVSVLAREDEPGTMVVLTLRAMTVEALEARMGDSEGTPDSGTNGGTAHV